MTTGAGRNVGRDGYREVVVLKAVALERATSRSAPWLGSDTDTDRG